MTNERPKVSQAANRCAKVSPPKAMTNERPKVSQAANRCAKVSPPEGGIEKNRGEIYILAPLSDLWLKREYGL